MNSHRLARLMGIICDIKAHPRRNPDEMCRRLGVSRRQFYKDREALAEMGIAFHYARQQQGFLLDKEPTFSVGGQSLTDLFALVLAVRQLTQLDDFGLAAGALEGLRKMVAQLPDPLRLQFGEVLDELVVADGFGCPPEVYATLSRALKEGWRVVLVMDTGGPAEERLDVLPARLFLRGGVLYLEAEGLEPDKVGVVALARVRKAIGTPLFSGAS